MNTIPSPSGIEIPSVPYPPTTGSMDESLQLTFNVVLWIIVAIFTFLAYKDYKKSQSPIAFLFLIGGGLCMFIEPIVDVMGLVWFYREGQWVLFEVFGRPIPTFILPTYIFYVGGQAFYTYSKLSKGASTATIWKIYFSYAVINLFLEEPPLHFGLYTYYGAQPLQIGLLPLWWPMINAAMPIVMAAVIYRLKPHLSGWKLLATIPLMPMCDALTNAAVGWPVWTALNSSDSYIVSHIAVLITFALALLLIHIITLVAGNNVQRPVLQTSRPAEI